MTRAARETVAAVLNDQARACASLGSPLYAFLLERGRRRGPRRTGVEVLERRGCDPHPLDPCSAADRLTLRSYVWPDQPVHVRRLEAALEIARSVPAPVDRALAVDWLAARLDERPQDAATVVFHSIVVQYLTDEERSRLRSLLCETGRRNRAGAPLAWLRMEPAGSHAAVHLTMWPDGAEQLLATSGHHGSTVHWPALSP